MSVFGKSPAPTEDKTMVLSELQIQLNRRRKAAGDEELTPSATRNYKPIPPPPVESKWVYNSSNNTFSVCSESQIKGWKKTVKTLENGDKYEGYVDDDGVMQGSGTYMFSNGNRYEGSWKDNKFHDKGRLHFFNN